MNKTEKVLLIVGSPRGQKSTSASLGAYLMSKIQKAGFEAQTVSAADALKSDINMRETLAVVENADILIIAFPLYVDAVPYPLVKLMENIYEQRKTNINRKRLRLLAIVNNGFPEAHHNDIAIAICRRFAGEAGMDWTGGLALGGGHSIDGQQIEKLGFFAKNIRKSLDMAADALINDKPLPEEAIRLISKPLIPSWLYLWIGERGWKRTAKRNGTWEKINERPYEKYP